MIREPAGTRLSDAAVIEMIGRLIAFDTTSRNSNLALIEHVGSYLESLGIAPTLIFSDDGRKANLLATLGGSGEGGIMLSGHTDVVPVDGQDWHVDPFQLTQRDGRLYGRGTADMKGFLGVVLALLPEFLSLPGTPPLHIALSYDEEVGCLGVRRLIERLPEGALRPRACIVGEPTSMKVVTAHKGKKAVRCAVRGLACHSALAHQGVNAVEAAAELVAQLKAMARRRREAGPFDPAFSPPYTTIHTGAIHGGTALNIVPEDCLVEFEVRNVPADDPERLFDEIRAFAEAQLLPEMRAVGPQAGFSWRDLASYPGLATAADSEIARLAAALTGENGTGTISFGSEAGLFSAAGIPTIVCGPGSMAQGHKPDEYVELDQIALCARFVRRLFARLAAAPVP